MLAYHCEHCGKYWSYPVKKCIFCKEDTHAVSETKYTVIGFTSINVPSQGNEKVPYVDYLLEDRNGNKIIMKSFSEYPIGYSIDLAEKKNNAVAVGVVGTGTLGSGIAEYLLRNGCEVTVKTRSSGSADKATAALSRRLAKDHQEAQVKELLKNIRITTEYGDLKGCDVIIEAVSEDMEVKKDVFRTLSGLCEPKTIFATNTSSLSIDEIASVTDRPDRFIGVHFFNPVSRMDLIEVVVGRDTNAATKDRVIGFCKAINKKPVAVSNYPGFIVNRLLLPQINDAVRLHEGGVATKEDIDAAMKMGLNHPMGPFALADLIGIDVCVKILETLWHGLSDERYKPAATLYGLLESGKTGVKAGEGFYKYK
ncbi:MAG: 3-hydroxyacyl-CoA dehydrogenase NAD-binding domain-containing protein [Methanocella sp.]